MSKLTANLGLTSDLPLPASKRVLGAASTSKYPFDMLEVGQSFAVPLEANVSEPSAVARALKLLANRLAQAKAQAKKRADWSRNYSLRTVLKDDILGVPAVRVWRTE